MIEIARWDGADAEALSEIARAAALHVDFAAERARPHAHVWVAREAGATLGFLLAWEIADELHVVDVATAPAARRRGVASALLRAALAHARGVAVRLVLLEVRRGNAAAIALYRAHGFALYSVRRGYYSDPVEDALELRREYDTTTREPVPLQDELDIPEP